MDLSVLGDLPTCSVSMARRTHVRFPESLIYKTKTACFAVWCFPVAESCLCPDKKPHAVPWDEDLTNCLFSNCTFAEQIGA